MATTAASHNETTTAQDETGVTIHAGPEPDPAAAAVSLLFVVVLLLGLQFTGAIPASSTLAFIPILALAGIGQLLLGLIAVRSGEHVIGLFFCTFGPFLVSFSALVLGLLHGWFPVPAADVGRDEASFLIGWTAMLTIWLFLTVVLPRFFTILLALIDIGLWAFAYSLWNTNSAMTKTAGWFLLASAVGAGYFVASRWLSWVGYDALPLGGPLLRQRVVQVPTS